MGGYPKKTIPPDYFTDPEVYECHLSNHHSKNMKVFECLHNHIKFPARCQQMSSDCRRTCIIDNTATATTRTTQGSSSTVFSVEFLSLTNRCLRYFCSQSFCEISITDPYLFHVQLAPVQLGTLRTDTLPDGSIMPKNIISGFLYNNSYFR